MEATNLDKMAENIIDIGVLLTKLRKKTDFTIYKCDKKSERMDPDQIVI